MVVPCASGSSDERSSITSSSSSSSSWSHESTTGGFVLDLLVGVLDWGVLILRPETEEERLSGVERRGIVVFVKT